MNQRVNNVTPLADATLFEEVRSSVQREVSEAAWEAEDYNMQQPVKITKTRSHKMWSDEETLQVFILKAKHYSYEKIAKELDRTETSISSLIHGIRKREHTGQWEERAEIRMAIEIPTQAIKIPEQSNPGVSVLIQEIEDDLLNVATKMEALKEQIKPYINIARELKNIGE